LSTLSNDNDINADSMLLLSAAFQYFCGASHKGDATG